MNVIGNKFSVVNAQSQTETAQTDQDKTSDTKQPKARSSKSLMRAAKKDLISHLPEISSPPDTTARAKHRRPPPKNLNGRRVAGNAMLSGVSTALSFGLLASMNNMARLHPNATVKMVGAHAPLVAGMASAYISHGIQNAFDIISSASSKASLVYDTISPAIIMGTSYTYAFSKLPKFLPTTPAGVATTVLVTGTGAAIGGAMTELAAQVWPHQDETKRKQGVIRAPSTFQVAIGRAITQLPAVELNKKIAKLAVKASLASVPKKMLLAGPATSAVPFMLRRAATPTSVRKAKDLTPVEAAPEK